MQIEDVKLPLQSGLIPYLRKGVDNWDLLKWDWEDILFYFKHLA